VPRSSKSNNDIHANTHIEIPKENDNEEEAIKLWNILNSNAVFNTQRVRFLPRTNLSPLKKTSFTDLNNDYPHLLPRPRPQQNTNET
jgi:hypothetical protein